MGSTFPHLAIFDAFSNNDIDKMKCYVVDDFLWTPPMSNLDSLSVEAWENQMKLFNELYDNIQFMNAQYYAGLDDTMKPNGDVRVYGTWKSNYSLTGEATELDYYSVLFLMKKVKLNLNQNGIIIQILFPQLLSQQNL